MKDETWERQMGSNSLERGGQRQGRTDKFSRKLKAESKGQGEKKKKNPKQTKKDKSDLMQKI